MARAIAPFPLPVYPVRVSQYWAFTSGTGDLPTLPVAALQVHAATVMPDFATRVDGRTRAAVEQPSTSGSQPETIATAQPQ